MQHQQELDSQSLPESERYIHVVSRFGESIGRIIVTFNPFLASLVHTAYATTHDNTYKRVEGSWKEWEVVQWVSHLNMRE